MPMDMRRLQMFLAVQEHQSFTRAAKASFISQPALSQCIKELENQMGAVLFHRLGRRVTLTPAGEALVGPASQVVREFEAGRRAVQAVKGLQAGRLDLVCLPSLAADPLAPLIGAFRSRYPGVMVVVTSPRDPADLARLVAHGTCELGVTDACDVPKDMVAKPLVTQELFAVLPPGIVPAAEPMTIEALHKIPIVSTQQGTYTRNVLDQAFFEAGLTPNLAVVSEQRDAVPPLVLSGAGAALLPRPLAQALQAQGAVMVGLQPKLFREVVMIHRSSAPSPAAQAFSDMA